MLLLPGLAHLVHLVRNLRDLKSRDLLAYEKSGADANDNVSQIGGNLVDLESDLLGVTRKASLCPSKKFRSVCATSDPNDCRPNDITIDGPGCNQRTVVDTSLRHLPACNMFRYKPVALPPALDLPPCPGPQPSRCGYTMSKVYNNKGN